VNVATAVAAAATVTVHVFAFPVHAPVQPPNSLPAAAAACERDRGVRRETFGAIRATVDSGG
jgi:hypothetical protein